MEKFELFEHTADVGVRVYGENIKQLFINAAEALFSLVIDEEVKARIEQRLEKKIDLETERWEDLLVSWLNELIFNFSTYRFIPQNYNLILEERNVKRLNAIVKGDDFIRYGCKVNLEVKAATYHNLEIEKLADGGVKAEIIFDV